MLTPRREFHEPGGQDHPLYAMYSAEHDQELLVAFDGLRVDVLSLQPFLRWPILDCDGCDDRRELSHTKRTQPPLFLLYHSVDANLEGPRKAGSMQPTSDGVSGFSGKGSPRWIKHVGQKYSRVRDPMD